MNRKIDNLGRIVIPMEIRKKLNIEINDTLFFRVENNELIITKEEESLRDFIINLMFENEDENVSNVLNKILDKLNN